MTYVRRLRAAGRAAIAAFRSNGCYPPDFPPEVIAMFERVRPFTMTSPERLWSTCSAVEHAVRHDIRGALVECGVWKGGSVLAMILTLQRLSVMDRDIFLFDTFDGMTEPTDKDVAFGGVAARGLLEQDRDRQETSVMWCKAGVENVRSVIESTGYPRNRLHFVKGPVETTIPQAAPASIALLRLDTDWYESTKHELEHLFPRLARGGILIVDDYGHWQGARKAVDEYFLETSTRILLHRVDYTGRAGVKE